MNDLTSSRAPHHFLLVLIFHTGVGGEFNMLLNVRHTQERGAVQVKECEAHVLIELLSEEM